MRNAVDPYLILWCSTPVVPSSDPSPFVPSRGGGRFFGVIVRMTEATFEFRGRSLLEVVSPINGPTVIDLDTVAYLEATGDSTNVVLKSGHKVHFPVVSHEQFAEHWYTYHQSKGWLQLRIERDGKAFNLMVKEDAVAMMDDGENQFVIVQTEVLRVIPDEEASDV